MNIVFKLLYRLACTKDIQKVTIFALCNLKVLNMIIQNVNNPLPGPIRNAVVIVEKPPLLRPHDRPQGKDPNDRKQACKGMPHRNKKTPSKGHNKLDKLLRLVKVFLLLDIVPFCTVASRRNLLFLTRVRREVQNGREGYRRRVEWNEPDGEYLEDGDVEL